MNSYLEEATEESIEAYFQIIESGERWAQLERVQELGIDSSSLEQAENASNQLTGWEIHALKLAYLTNGGRFIKSSGTDSDI